MYIIHMIHNTVTKNWTQHLYSQMICYGNTQCGNKKYCYNYLLKGYFSCVFVLFMVGQGLLWLNWTLSLVCLHVPSVWYQ